MDEINELIQMALTDGVITEKERNIIIKKALSLGMDKEEVELQIDAEQQKIQIAEEKAHKKRKGAICPNCGLRLPPLTKICPNCNTIVNDGLTQEQDIDMLISSIYRVLTQVKSGPWKRFEQNSSQLDGLLARATIFYGENPKVKNIVSTVRKEHASLKRKHAWPKVLAAVIAAGALALCIYIGYRASFVTLDDAGVYYAGIFFISLFALGAILTILFADRDKLKGR